MSDTPTHDPLYKVRDACTYLSVSRSTIYNLFKDGELTAVDLRRPGSVRPDVRVRLSVLNDYIARHDRSKK